MATRALKDSHRLPRRSRPAPRDGPAGLLSDAQSKRSYERSSRRGRFGGPVWHLNSGYRALGGKERTCTRRRQQ
eukprot:9457614-Lingulodinium_polyedra.AAC.1